MTTRGYPSESFGEIFQRVKHDNYRLSKNEIDSIVLYLDRDESLKRSESHAAIYVLCLSTRPDSEYISIVERFLSSIANDYARQAALICLTTIWEIHNDKYSMYIHGILSDILKDDAPETRAGAISAASFYINRFFDKRIADAFSKALDVVYLESLTRNSSRELLIDMCRSMADKNAIRLQLSRVYIGSYAEAVEIYKKKKLYLSLR